MAESVPLRWAAGDRARWRDQLVDVHYVAGDRALVQHGPRFAIVPIADLSLNLPPHESRSCPNKR